MTALGKDSGPAAALREAMALFPSGVTIMTTVDESGRDWGFAASSFCSLSLDPPLVLVCLAKTAQCYEAFQRGDHWAIQIANSGHRDLVTKFSTRGADKFGGGEFGRNEHGVPVLPDAPIVLHCRAYKRHDGGDHAILVAQVDRVDVRDAAPVLYFRRDLHSLDHVLASAGESR
ncbi:flavin reductase family protein [Amycolatopsis thermoflava]|uniref:flavin reductase family protein n=1 Tax=Amycolatopsis thermoflava TaxID=84480 RepID=UPI00382D0D61